MKNILIFAFICAITWYGCNEAPIGQTPTDSTAPGQVRNYSFESLPGGARITYELPGDEDLLCVKAVYHINGIEKNVVSTLYNKSLEIEGFGTTEEQSVTLYCVDRSGNHSEPTAIRITPGTPPVTLIRESMTIDRGFGGIQLNWKNEAQANVAIYFVAADSIGDLSVADILYTSVPDGKFNLRGFDDSERLFGVYVRDRWDNYSTTLLETHTPLFEVKLDKSLWSRGSFPGDNTSEYDGGNWSWNSMRDDITDQDQGWHTGDGKSPMYFTIDLGVTTRLSRYTLWHRGNDWFYRHHNPKKWKVYGSANPNFAEQSEAYWTGEGFRNDWHLLAECESFKPSGDDSPLTQADRDYARLGFEFELPLDAPAVRYIRFHVEENWSGGDNLHIAELSFWGQ